MKPVDAEENPGLAKLPTEVRNKMGYMKKGGIMKKPMKKTMGKRTKRFGTGGETRDEYKGTDEMVQYRMGQIKDPGVDLFKLTSGEAQEAKPVPLDKKPEVVEKNKYVPNSDSAMDNRDVGETAKNAYIPNKNSAMDNKDVGETAKKQSFGEAFKSARAGGDKTFTYNGKSYTTELAKPSSSSSSTSNAKPADKPTAKTEPKAETKAETKTETKVEPKDDKPVPVKVDRETKTASKKYKSPGITDLTGTGTSDEERSDNVSKLLKGVKSIFSGPADYIEKGSPKMREMRAKDALKSGMASKDRDSMRKGGSVKMASGGKVSSASKRADGCAVRGKTRA